MKRGVLFTVVGLIAFIGFFSSSVAYAKLAGKELKIGVITCITGPLAAFGQAQQLAARIAEEEINAAGGVGGVPLKLMVEDNALDQAQAINLTKKFIDQDKVPVVVGPFSNYEAEVSYPVSVRAKVPNISPTASRVGLMAKFRPWGFTLFTTSDRTLKPLVDKWVDDNKIKKVGLIYDNKDVMTKLDAEDVFPDLLKAKGVEIVEKVTFITGDLDFSAQVTKVLAKKPDGIIISSNYGEGANVAREARKQGYKGSFMGGVGLYHPKYVDNAGPAAEGTYTTTSFWMENPDARVQNYVAKYRSKSGGKDPEATGGHMYDLIYILKDVVEKSGVTNRPADLAKDREKIRKGLEGLKEYKGITGTVTINKDGDAIRGESFILVVKGGKFQRL